MINGCGYVVYYMPKHHLADKSGLVYEHKLVAEKILGRKLKAGEVVHHKDKNRQNNSEENLIVFKNDGEHTAYHNFNCDENILIKNDDNSYSINYYKTKALCPYCGKIGKEHRAEMCIDCYNKRKSINVPTKEKLEEELFCEKGNFCKVAKNHGVTDNAVRKWCKKYSMSFHSKDYKLP